MGGHTLSLRGWLVLSRLFGNMYFLRVLYSIKVTRSIRRVLLLIKCRAVYSLNASKPLNPEVLKCPLLCKLRLGLLPERNLPARL